MGHYARAGGELCRKGDETEVRAHIEAAIGSESIESKGNGTHRGGCGQFGSSSAELCGYRVEVHTAESQQLCGHLPVQRK